MDLTEALRDSQERLAVREQALVDLEREVSELRSDVRVLERLSQRYGLVADDTESKASIETSGLNEWQRLARTDAIVRALTEADAPLSPSDISERLIALGREDDSPHNVSAALNHLMRKNRAFTVARGQWVAGSLDLSLADPDEVVEVFGEFPSRTVFNPPAEPEREADPVSTYP